MVEVGGKRLEVTLPADLSAGTATAAPAATSRLAAAGRRGSRRPAAAATR